MPIIFIFCLVYLGSHNLILYAQVVPSECIEFDPQTVTIKVMCGNFNLSKLSKELENSNILSSNKKEWTLSANLEIGTNATFFINATDASWVKIEGDSKNENYGIKNNGNLIIDHTKISSWNRETGSVIQQTDDGSIKRPYLLMKENSTGQMNITYSDISYLGWNRTHEQGIAFYSGEHSIIDNNNIHDLYYGFYTIYVGNLIISNNQIHHNFKYGLDPHTATHDLLIKNNTVHDTKGIGIVCSLYCSNVLIENNTVYNNSKAGIMFSKGMSNSVVRNNVLHNEYTAISISDSNSNQIYGNKISDSKIGVALKVLSPSEYSTAGNVVFNNTIYDSDVGIGIDDKAKGNIIHDNTILNSTNAGISIPDFTTRNNSIYNNTFSNNGDDISTKSFKSLIPVGLRNTAPSWCKNEISISGFVEGLKFLESIKILSEPETQSNSNATQIIPDWVKNNACWWSKRLISDIDFVSGIQYLIDKGIIVIPQKIEIE